MATKKQTKKASVSKTVSKVVSKRTVSATRAEMLGRNLGLKLKNVNFKFVSKVVAIVAVGLVLFFLATRFKGLVIAGIVNKKPIFRNELNQTLAKRYGKVVLDEMINNELIKQEAKKMGVEVSDTDIEQELAALQEKIGGEQALNDALVQYGLTKEELREQIRVSVLQKKIAEKVANIEVTQEEIDEYFKTNSAYYEGKKLEEVSEEISTLLKDQKRQEEFGTWFAEVKAKAQVETYID